MAEFKVQTTQLQNYANQISAMQRELDSVAVRLGAMQLGSVLRVRASTALIGRVGDCKWAAAHQSDDLGLLARGLEEIAQLYETVEKNLSDPKTEAQAQAQAEAAAQEEDWNLWDAILDNNPLVDALGTLAEFLIDKVVKLGETVSKWSNKIFAGIGSLIDNVEEFAGDLFSFRFLYEFVGEAAVDYALGATLGAFAKWGVGALLTAAGVANPAIWAAAAGFAAVWIADVVCTWINGEGVDISEWVVDKIWEGGEWVVEQVDNAIDAAGEFISDAVDTAGEFIDNAVDAAGEFIEDAGEAIDQAFDVVQEGAEALWSGAVDFFDSITPW